MSENAEIKNVTGLSHSSGAERKSVEKDMLTTLLELSEEKTSVEAATEIEIKRNGEVRLSFKVHQVSDEDIRRARKSATKNKPNPNGRKLPPIEWDRDETKYRSMVIYIATIPEDQKRVWGNAAFMEKKGCMEPYETVEHILNVGEKLAVFDRILELSGMADDDEGEESLEEYAKN